MKMKMKRMEKKTVMNTYDDRNKILDWIENNYSKKEREWVEHTLCVDEEGCTLYARQTDDDCTISPENRAYQVYYYKEEWYTVSKKQYSISARNRSRIVSKDDPNIDTTHYQIYNKYYKAWISCSHYSYDNTNTNNKRIVLQESTESLDSEE